MIITNDPAVEISRMFLDPNEECADDRRPLLYLLRRDLQNQYGKEAHPPSKVFSPLLTGLGIMVGFEVLTKLWTGNHDVRTEQIEEFFKNICSLPEGKAIALAQFRHALAHGYRLQTLRHRDWQMYSFSVSDVPDGKECIADLGSYFFEVNLWRLKDLFITAIKKYRCLLESSSDLQRKFMVTKANIGEIEIKG
jgi:hypothetical protein